MQTTTYLSTARKAIATTTARDETLLTADGYTIEPYADRPGIYAVTRGENDHRPLRAGETLWNDVDVCNQDCTCQGFRFRGTCKHLISTTKALAEAARLMAPMLPVVIADTPWPPVDRTEATAFKAPTGTFTERFAAMTSEQKRRQMAADFA